MSYWARDGFKKKNGNFMKNHDLIEMFYDAATMSENHVRIRKVPDHKGIKGNEYADSLARIVCSSVRK